MFILVFNLLYLWKEKEKELVYRKIEKEFEYENKSIKRINCIY